MRVSIAGGTGLIGSAVAREAESRGHEVKILHVPRPSKHQAHRAEAWEQALQAWQPETFSGADTVMFFGGEPINSRWTDKKKMRIQLSRQMPCRRMAECVAAAAQKPAVVVSASATGYYGNRQEETLTEESHSGSGFLPATTAAWEEAWLPAVDAGIRVVQLRIGVVLNPRGGALKVMLPAFKLGLGGRMGSGQQWLSWITDGDLASLVIWAMENEKVAGPINAVAPNPVRQIDFARTLARAVGRPAVAPAPAFVLKLAFGQMAEETVLTSCRALPSRAAEAGFHFHHPELTAALDAVL